MQEDITYIVHEVHTSKINYILFYSSLSLRSPLLSFFFFTPMILLHHLPSSSPSFSPLSFFFFFTFINLLLLLHLLHSYNSSLSLFFLSILLFYSPPRSLSFFTCILRSFSLRFFSTLIEYSTDAGTASILYDGITSTVTAIATSPTDSEILVTTDKDSWIKVRTV